MSYQTTLHRTLAMMGILSRPIGWTTEQLAEEFEVHQRTIQRTIKTIEDAGYVIEYQNNRYRINHEETKAGSSFDIGNLLHFSKEEAWMLNEAINQIPGENSIKENLVKKLYSIYSSDIVVRNITRQEDSEQVKIIIEAIENKFQLIVKEYTMSTANKGLRSVLIEPLEFASDYSRVWAYFPKQNKNFLLRLSGIDGVEATYEKYQFERFHKVGFIDIFRGYGYSKTPITLILNARAYGFMCEEFPMSKSFIIKIQRYHYELKTDVCDFAPVARFYLGLPGDIEIRKPESLVEHIKNIPLDVDRELYPELAIEEDPGDVDLNIT